jgi:hypothetical protein
VSIQTQAAQRHRLTLACRATALRQPRRGLADKRVCT